MSRVVVAAVLLFTARLAQGAECASPLLDSHIAGIRTFLGGYSPGFSPGQGVAVADFPAWTKTLTKAQVAALKVDGYVVVKSAKLDTAKAGHLRGYMTDSADTQIPWWVTLPANAVPGAWIGLAIDGLVAALDGVGAPVQQSLSQAAGTVAVGGTVEALERVIQSGSEATFVSITVYQAKVGDELRTTVLQRCTAQVVETK